MANDNSHNLYIFSHIETLLEYWQRTIAYADIAWLKLLKKIDF